MASRPRSLKQVRWSASQPSGCTVVSSASITSDYKISSQDSLENKSQGWPSDTDLDRPTWTALAHILRPQGRKGEVLAELYTDLPEQLGPGKRVFLAKEAFVGSEKEASAIEVASYFLPVGRNAGRVVLHFRGIASIGAAEALAGLDVLIPATERQQLDDDAKYVSDLVGCTLFDRKADVSATEVGMVTGVQFSTTPDGSRRLEEAAPLLVVQTSAGEEVLVPYVKAFLLSLDMNARRIEMSLPDGLLDINRPA